MTTIKLSGGNLGSDQMFVRCNLADAAAPVQVDYDNGCGWTGTQYQCADARHRNSGMIEIGKSLAAAAVEMSDEGFVCDATEVE